MVATNNKNGFTLIEFLIALLIIGFIVAILVGVFSSPLKQAKMDSAIAQVKDGLRQISEAGQLLEAHGKCSDWACFDNAAALGGLTAQPAIPAGIAADGVSAEWGSSDHVSGGCGLNNAGAALTFYPVLKKVSDEFCSEYNRSAGLAGEVGKNCTNGGDCTASGSTSDSDFPVQSSPTFCYYNGGSDSNIVIFLAGVPSNNPCSP